MIMVNVNTIGIRHTLANTGSALNIFGINLLPKIKFDSYSLATSSLYICGFDNVGR